MHGERVKALDYWTIGLRKTWHGLALARMIPSLLVWEEEYWDQQDLSKEVSANEKLTNDVRFAVSFVLF